MRKAPALLLTAGLAVATLTSCSAAPATACGTPMASGASSDLVDVTGDFGSAPQVDFPTPLKVETAERSIVIDGDGDVVAGDQVVQMSFELLDGKSGEPLPNSGYGDPSFYLPSQLPEGIAAGLECATVGSRIVIAAPATEFADGLDTKAHDSVVMVADIVTTFPSRATGADRPVLEPGFPSIVLGEDGRPGFTIPKSDPPTELKVAVLKEGDGEKLTAKSSFLAQYSGALWKEQTIFDSSWEKGSPMLFSMDGIIPGLADALAGQKVGSQVLVVIPPKLGYGDQASGTVPANSTLIFVVDILGTIE